MYEQNQELMFVQGITGGTCGEILLGIARAHVVEKNIFFSWKIFFFFEFLRRGTIEPLSQQ
jgi:hypothetical protein